MVDVILKVVEKGMPMNLNNAHADIANAMLCFALDNVYKALAVPVHAYNEHYQPSSSVVSTQAFRTPLKIVS